VQHESETYSVIRQKGHEFCEKNIARWRMDDWDVRNQQTIKNQIEYWKTIKANISQICGKR